MYLLRPHRGSLSDSMADLKTFETKEDMMGYVAEDLKHWIHGGTFTITVERYNDSRDERIDWDTTDVVSWVYDGQRYVWGFCTEKEGHKDILEEQKKELFEVVSKHISSFADEQDTSFEAITDIVCDILKAGYRKLFV